MSAGAIFVMASFTVPEQVGTNPYALLWLLPLVAAIAIVYKVTKLPTITAGSFLKDVAVLSGSIIVFVVVIALALFILTWLITG